MFGPDLFHVVRSTLVDSSFVIDLLMNCPPSLFPFFSLWLILGPEPSIKPLMSHNHDFFYPDHTQAADMERKDDEKERKTAFQNDNSVAP
jgi:hypothetical protein